MIERSIAISLIRELYPYRLKVYEQDFCLLIDKGSSNEKTYTTRQQDVYADFLSSMSCTYLAILFFRFIANGT